jgi:hypothetical protein
MAALPALPEERCPRCGGAFRCGIGDDAPCPCTGVRLSAALQAQLRERFDGCLCLGCLHALAAGAPLLPGTGDSLGRGAGGASHNRPGAPAAKDDAP